MRSSATHSTVPTPLKRRVTGFSSASPASLATQTLMAAPTAAAVLDMARIRGRSPRAVAMRLRVTPGMSEITPVSGDRRPARAAAAGSKAWGLSAKMASSRSAAALAVSSGRTVRPALATRSWTASPGCGSITSNSGPVTGPRLVRNKPAASAPPILPPPIKAIRKLFAIFGVRPRQQFRTWRPQPPLRRPCRPRRGSGRPGRNARRHRGQP